MESSKFSSKDQAAAAAIPFHEALLKARVAQICDSVGYHAITQDSSNILHDIYRRTIHHLARHCKDAANNNRRVEPTIIDLVQAYDFVGINIPDLQDYIESVKLPSLNVDLNYEEPIKNLKGIQRNLLVDDLLEAEKNNHLDNQHDGENKAMSESGRDDEDEKPSVPLLKDAYEEIANKFTECTPVTADKKIRLGGRVLVLANTKLKITTPILPEPTPSTSAGITSSLEIKLSKKRKKKGGDKRTLDTSASSTASPMKKTKGKKRKKLSSQEFILPGQDSDLEVEKKPIKLKIKDEKKDKQLKNKSKTKTGKRPYNKKPKVAITPLDPAIAEPPSFFPLVEENIEPDPVVIKKEKLSPSPKMPKEEKTKKRKHKVDEVKLEPTSGTEEVEKKSKRGRKKLKTNITPLDPSIAELPSFLPILDHKEEEVIPEIMEPVVKVPTPLPVKQSSSKNKKKKKSSNQFAIVTETVTDADKGEPEWFCPGCGLADDGDWVQCDTCQDWYHLICTGLDKAPEDDENWECVKCSTKKKVKAQKKHSAPIEVLKLKTPEPPIKTPPIPKIPTPQPQLQSQIQMPSTSNVPLQPGISQIDLCPECNLPDDGTMMIQCDDPFCARWFHGKCVNLLEEPKEDESWFCNACVDKQQSAFKRRRKAK